jgi:hypothetical protein
MIDWRIVRAVRAWPGEIWLLLQATAAATLAWVVAERIGEHSDPFFAPIAAVVALSFPRGERGLSTVRLLAGVGVGIIAGELMLVLLGGGSWSLALAIFVAVVAARWLGPNRLLRNQAAAAAILTVAVADGEAGVDRLLDALIGAAVALVFTQVLFTPSPVGLVRRAEVSAITSMSDGLQQVADAVQRGEDELARVAAERLRAVRDELSELARATRASSRIVHHSLLWRSQRAALGPVIAEAGRLDLLGAGCLMLVRTAVAADPSAAQVLLPAMRQLAGTLAALAAADLDDTQIRQRAADQADHLLQRFAGEEAPADLVMAGAVASLRMVAYDMLRFAGVDERPGGERGADRLR